MTTSRHDPSTHWCTPNVCKAPPAHDPCCTCDACDEPRFRPSTAGHVFDRSHLATDRGAALTSFNRSGVKR